MTAEVVPLDPRKRRRQRPKGEECPCPEHLSPEQVRSVLNFAKAQGYSLERVQFAWISVRGWWDVHQKLRKDWAAVTRNAIKDFWGERGFRDWMARRSWRGPERQLTTTMIEQLVEKQREWFKEHEA